MQSSKRSKGWAPAATALGGALVVFSGCGHAAPSGDAAQAKSRAGETATTCVSTTAITGPGFQGGGAVAINALGQVTGRGTFASAGGSEHAFFWDGHTASDLGTLGGATSLPWAMNDNGWVAGQSLTGGADNETHATLWHDGTVVDLGTLGGSWSVARSINNAGQIVGPSTVAADGQHMHAFLWESGVMKDLGTLGGSDSNAAQINDRGQILGRSTMPDGSQHTFLWESGAMTDLGTFGGKMNERGDIAGLDGTKMYLRRSDGTRIEIVPFAGATSSTIVARDDRGNTLNDVGQVIGLTTRADGSSVSFLWQESTPTQTIGPADSAYAVGINNSAQVAGYIVDGPAVRVNGGIIPPPTRAFSWKEGKLTYLGPADLRTDVIGINDRGQIAGATPTGPVIWETSPCGTADGGSSGANESDAAASSSSSGGSSSGGSGGTSSSGGSSSGGGGTSGGDTDAGAPAPGSNDAGTGGKSW